MTALIFFISVMQRLNVNQKFACNMNVHTALHSEPDYLSPIENLFYHGLLTGFKVKTSNVGCLVSFLEALLMLLFCSNWIVCFVGRVSFGCISGKIGFMCTEVLVGFCNLRCFSWLLIALKADFGNNGGKSFVLKTVASVFRLYLSCKNLLRWYLAFF